MNSDPNAVGVKSQWERIAKLFHSIGPPLRPSRSDISIYEEMIREISHDSVDGVLDALLLGVTPEIATLAWPENTELLAVDRLAPMLALVWPGDIPGRRISRQEDWLELPTGSKKFDVVIGDGCFTLQEYPSGYYALRDAIFVALKPGGYLIMRSFVCPEELETPHRVFSCLESRSINSAEIFKWRLAMTLLSHTDPNVPCNSIWQMWNSAGMPDPVQLTTPGAMTISDSLAYYEGSNERLSFPMLKQLLEILGQRLEIVKVVVPRYELGERCPIVLARKPGNGDL